MLRVEAKYPVWAKMMAKMRMMSANTGVVSLNGIARVMRIVLVVRRCWSFEGGVQASPQLLVRDMGRLLSQK